MKESAYNFEHKMNTDTNPSAEHKNCDRSNYFTVPEGYFEKLPDEINAKLNAQGHLLTKKHHNVRNITFISGLAAAVIVVMLIFSFLIKKQLPQNNNSNAISDADEAITEYLEENLDENTLWENSNNSISFFDADKLKEIIATDDTIKQTIENNFVIDTSLKKEDILDYLLNENIDPETL